MSRLTCKKRGANVEAFVDAMEIRSFMDVSAAAVMDYLSERTGPKLWSAKTHDNHLDSLRDFGRFLKQRYGETFADPLPDVGKAQRVAVVYGTQDTGVRAFAQSESDAVIARAHDVCEPMRKEQNGNNRNRDWCYELFRETGLRHLEMKLLPWADVYIDAEPCVIKCTPAWNKNRTYQHLPLSARAAEILRKQRDFTRGELRVWRTVPSLATLNLDMKAAGVAKVDGRGRAAAFHSFRKELDTETGRNNMPLDVRMRLMRHTDPKLTLRTYSDFKGKEIADVLARFMPRRDSQEARLSTTCPQTGPPGREDLTKRGRISEHCGGNLASQTLAPTHDHPLLGPDPARGSQNFRSGLGAVGRVPAGTRGEVRKSSKCWGREATNVGGSNPPLSASTPSTSDPNLPLPPRGEEAVAALLAIALLIANISRPA